MSSNRVFFGKIGKNNQVERVLPAQIGTSKPVRIPKNSNSAVRNIETTDEFHETVQTTYEWNHGRNPLSSIENNQNQGQSQPRSNYLQFRSKRRMNQKNQAKWDKTSATRERLQNKFWLLYYMEDHTCSVIQAVHSGIQMDPYDRTEVEREQTIEIKLEEKNPNRNDYMWSGVVKAIGDKEYVERCAEQMTQIIDSNKSYDVSQGPSLSESLLNSSAAKVPPFNTNIQELLELELGNSKKRCLKFSKVGILEQQENDEDIFNKDPDEEELSDTEYIEHNVTHPQNEMIIEQLENDQDIFHIDLDEQEHYPTDDPNNVNIFANVEMKAPAVNSLKSKGRPVKRVESTPANKNKSKQAKGTSQLDPRDEFLVKAGQDFKHAAELFMDASSNQVNSMRSLEAAIEKLANRNYHEIRSSTEAVNKLVSLKFLRTALFTRR